MIPFLAVQLFIFVSLFGRGWLDSNYSEAKTPWDRWHIVARALDVFLVAGFCAAAAMESSGWLWLYAFFPGSVVGWIAFRLGSGGKWESIWL